MQILGLPLHPLVVHLAVVLVPLAALAYVATAWRPSWRARFARPIAATAVIGALAALTAAQTGEDLQESLQDVARAAGTAVRFGDHPDHGQAAEVAALLFAAAAVANWLVTGWPRRFALPAWAPRVVAAAGTLLGVAAIASITIAGDSGARLVWQQVGTLVPR